MTTIFYNKKKVLTIPDSLEELTPAQYLGIADILYNGGDEISCQVKAFKIFTGISDLQLKLMDPEKLNRCLPFVDWIFEPLNITQQLLPSYNEYYGPASQIDNLKMKEFHFSELFYHQHVIEKEDAALNNLIAVLYRKALPWYKYSRKKNKNGDIRTPFNPNLVDQDAAAISRWPVSVKHAMFMFYDGCRQHYIDEFPMIFKEPSKSGFKSQFNAGMYGMMLSLAGEKLGKVNDIEEMYVPTALLTLGMMIEQEKFFEEQMKK